VQQKLLVTHTAQQQFCAAAAAPAVVLTETAALPQGPDMHQLPTSVHRASHDH